MMRNPPAWWAFTELGRNAIARHNDRAFARALLTPLTEPTTMADARRARIAAVTARKRC